ncbi:MAG: MBL fold metallo-hydrolase [Puniceicoccaceae bacterium]
MEDKFRTYPLGPLATNAYAVFSPGGDQAVWFDAPAGSFDAMIQLSQTGIEIAALILTHGHWDHTLDAHRFARAGIPVYAHRADQVLLEQPEVMAPFAYPDLPLRPVNADHWLSGGDQLHLVGYQIEIRETPGHCPGNITAWFPVLGLAIVGDSIFSGSVGRTDLPGGDFDLLAQSIQQQIYTLPPHTVLLPGHGPATSVAHEQVTNPFVKA